MDTDNGKPSPEIALGKMRRKLEPLPAKNVSVKDDFWAKRLQQVREVVIPYQWEALNDRIPAAEPRHAIENFRIAAGRTGRRVLRMGLSG